MSSATGFERALPEMGFGRAAASVVVTAPRIDGPIGSPILRRVFQSIFTATILAAVTLGLLWLADVPAPPNFGPI
jgi:hypothetical protein